MIVSREGVSRSERDDCRYQAISLRTLIDHQSIWPTSPYIALAHLGIARACRLAHQDTTAGQEYQEFFALWEHADPGIPILRQAQIEFATVKPLQQKASLKQLN